MGELRECPVVRSEMLTEVSFGGRAMVQKFGKFDNKNISCDLMTTFASASKTEISRMKPVFRVAQNYFCQVV